MPYDIVCYQTFLADLLLGANLLYVRTFLPIMLRCSAHKFDPLHMLKIILMHIKRTQ